MINIKIKIKKLNKLAKLPSKGSQGSAGYDIYAAIKEKTLVDPGQVLKVPTGICIELPSSAFVGLVFARSGLGINFGMVPANAVGVIDSDYRGEVIVALRNHSDQGYLVQPGERIAQLVIVPVAECEFEEVIDLCETKRGEKGFGSTGIT